MTPSVARRAGTACAAGRSSAGTRSKMRPQVAAENAGPLPSPARAGPELGSAHARCASATENLLHIGGVGDGAGGADVDGEHGQLDGKASDQVRLSVGAL